MFPQVIWFYFLVRLYSARQTPRSAKRICLADVVIVQIVPIFLSSVTVHWSALSPGRGNGQQVLARPTIPLSAILSLHLSLAAVKIRYWQARGLNNPQFKVQLFCDRVREGNMSSIFAWSAASCKQLDSTLWLGPVCLSVMLLSSL